jgi:hypothetical protein
LKGLSGRRAYGLVIIMNVDITALKHFGVDGEPLDEARVQGFLKIPGIVVDSLDPGQHIDFITMRIRNEGGGRVSFAKSHHAFIEAIELNPGVAFLLYCTCPMVDKFVLLQRGR